MSLEAMIKGWFGEVQVSLCTKFLLDKAVYQKVNNVTLPTDNGTTQIDHILVSRYGVFVVETKNYQGWIFGKANQPQWTQSLPGGMKFQFQNPLNQNYRHIKALSDFLGLPEDKFHSVIIFIGECKFKTEMPENVMTHGFIPYVKSKVDVLFSDEDVAHIVDALKNGRLPPGWKTHKQHLASLKERHESTTKCPKCGGELVERKAKSGPNAGKAFLGCSNFPKCRFMKDVPQ